MKKEEFDRLFDLALEDAAKKLPSPDPGPSWSGIESKFQKSQMRPPGRLISYSALAASFLLGALIFSTPSVSNAFSPLVSAVKQFQSDVVAFVFGSRAGNEKLAITAAPPETAGELISNVPSQQMSYPSWEDARPHLAFSAPEIGYVPDAFQLDHVMLFTDGTYKAKTAFLIYISENASYQIAIRTLQTGESIVTGSEMSDGQYEEIQINGQKGYMFTDRSGRASLDFMRGSLVISISGSLSAEELVNIAKGIS
jgi:hypothetical protein